MNSFIALTASLGAGCAHLEESQVSSRTGASRSMPLVQAVRTEPGTRPCKEILAQHCAKGASWSAPCWSCGAEAVH